MNNTLQDCIATELGGTQNVLDRMARAGDAIEWALINSRPDGTDELELHARAVASLMQASVLLTGCDAWELAGGLRSLDAFFIMLIEGERHMQQTFGRDYMEREDIP